MNNGIVGMGFPVSSYQGAPKGISSAATTAFQIAGAQTVPAGWMGVFGNGLWQVFSSGGTFTVPPGVSQIRVRVVGAGSAAVSGGRGGCGGGYAHGIFNVSPGTQFSVTVGAGGASYGTAGVSSSFGSLISATGGTTTTPGTGTGGSFQASGGTSGNAANSGGGGAGSQLANGGNSTANSSSGGGGVGGGSGGYYGAGNGGGGGGSPFGSPVSTGAATTIGLGAQDITGAQALSCANGNTNAINAAIRFPFDGFTGGGGGGGGGGSQNVTGGGNGGVGGGGGGFYATSGPGGGNGGVGGGGGGGNSTGVGGVGGIGGGGGGSSSATAGSGIGGNGIIIVEF